MFGGDLFLTGTKKNLHSNFFWQVQKIFLQFVLYVKKYYDICQGLEQTQRNKKNKQTKKQQDENTNRKHKGPPSDQ